MALLRGSFTDEEERDKDRQEAPFDHTRTRVCSQSTLSSFKRSPLGCEEPEEAEILLRKREKKAKSFSFHNDIYTPLALVSILQ